MPVKKRRTRKRKFKTMTFKLSQRQQKSLLNYCKARRTTPTRLIKKMIRPYIQSYIDDVPDEFYVTEKQLNLFDE